MTEETFLATASTRGTTALEKASALIIVGDEHYEEAASLLEHIKDFKIRVMESTKPLVEAAHKAHKAVKDQQNKFLAPVNEAAAILGRKMGTYQEERELERLRIQRVEQDRLDAEAKTEAAELAEIILDENPELAMTMEDNAQAPVAVVPSLAPKVKGQQIRKTWHCEVIDASKVPREFMIPDEKAIGAYVRARKDSARIEGVRTWSKTHVH